MGQVLVLKLVSPGIKVDRKEKWEILEKIINCINNMCQLLVA